MRLPLRYWFGVAFSAAMIAACASRNGGTLPSLTPPGAAPQALSAADAASGLEPNAKPCYTRPWQPGWVFMGACGVRFVPRKGTAFVLGKYRGYAIHVVLPRNDARAGQRVLFADATGNGDAKAFAGKAFPLRANAFLYLKRGNRGRPIGFDKNGRITLTLRAASFPSGPCGIAALRFGKNRKSFWNPLSINATRTATSLTYRLGAAQDARIRTGASYFAFFCSGTVTPTPSSSPTSSPTMTPTPVATPPSYCANFHTPPPGASPNNPVIVTDRSGLPGAQVVLYVGANGQYLDAAGQYVTTASPQPLPLICYPGSTGGNGLTFEVPGGSNGRVYIAYATPGPNGNTVPNPFANVVNAPSIDPTSTSYVNTPYDFLEYTLPTSTTDVTQVDNIGLPIELSIGSEGPIGVTGDGYADILSAIQALQAPYTPFRNLLVSTTWTYGSSSEYILARVINPKDGIVWGVPQDWYNNPNVTGQSYSAKYPLGFLGYVLAQYADSANTYDYNISPAGSYSEYRACSDGSSTFYFAPVSDGTCSGSAPGVISIPATTFEPAGAGHGCQGQIFGQPPTFGNTGAQFYLWKSMTIDFNRGTILVSGTGTNQTHPVGGLGTPSSPVLPMSDYGKNVVYNPFWYIVHQNYVNNQAYVLNYDEPGGFAAAFSANAPTPWQITINKIPVLPAAIPSPTPAPIPSGCTGSSARHGWSR